jgi:hypothetical protein
MLRRNTSHLLPCKMFDIMGRTHDTAVVFEALRHFTFATEFPEGNISFVHVATGDRTYPPLVLQRGLVSHRSYFDGPTGSEANRRRPDDSARIFLVIMRPKFENR